jgi:hypothetical protein
VTGGMRSVMQSVTQTRLLALVLLLAACGGAGQAAPPANPPESASATAPSAQPSSSAASAASSAPAASSATPPSVSAPIELKAPIPTAFADDLKALGLDAANLPRMNKLAPKALRGVMKLFAKSLGVKCGDCHQEGDFAAPTPRKKVAAKMWDEFAAKLSFDDGTPLFCDSCHQGRTKQLDRTDKKALSNWMDASFVKRLKRKDGGEHGCETCHGSDWDMTFLKSWAK